MSKYFITTTLPYINSDPHLGFALEIIRADVLARWQRMLGNEVIFNTGTDEHGLKIYRKAEESGITTQEYCDKFALKFKELKSVLNLSYTHFTRTTDSHHEMAAQEFWNRCVDNGDIYKKNYQVKYCVGCELEKTDSELVNDRCPLHPNQDLEIIDEENYFFRFSKYQDKLLELYNDSNFLAPANRLLEIKNFVSAGLSDFSISRLRSKMPWGVAVPNDPDQVMYVWFDALVNYISCLGWPDNLDNFNNYWPGVQIAGKDNLRPQSAMWQAMLFSAGLPNTKQITINGFITVDGQKMSKSLGNVINPIELVEKYSSDAVRYYLLAEMLSHEDGDFTYEKFETKFNADLANGLGNLVSRVSNLLEKNSISLELNKNLNQDYLFKISQQLEKFEYNLAINYLWDILRTCDETLSATTPWKLDNQEEIKNILEPIAQKILDVANLLIIFLPETAEKVIKQFSEIQIKKGESLFARLSKV